MKLALLHGFKPVLSETQIVDTTPLLWAAAGEDAYVDLIAKGHIQLTLFTPQATNYRSALRTRLAGHWTSSAWTEVEKSELVRFLDRGGPMRSFSADLRRQYEGLTVLDGLIAHGRAPDRPPPAEFTFSERIRRLCNDILNPPHPEIGALATDVAQILKAIERAVPKHLIDASSVWIDILRSPAFVERGWDDVETGAFHAAMLAIVLIWNEVVASSVAGGMGARTLAWPGGWTWEQDVGRVLRWGFRTQPIRTARMRFSRPWPIDAVISPAPRAMKYLSWQVVRRVITDVRFQPLARDAMKNREAAVDFAKWLNDQVGHAVAEEYLSQEHPVLSVVGGVPGAALTPTGGSIEAILITAGRSPSAKFFQRPLAWLVSKNKNWRARGAMSRSHRWFLRQVTAPAGDAAHTSTNAQYD